MFNIDVNIRKHTLILIECDVLYKNGSKKYIGMCVKCTSLFYIIVYFCKLRFVCT